MAMLQQRIVGFLRSSLPLSSSKCCWSVHIYACLSPSFFF